MEKVYCKNCRYFKKTLYDFGYDYCKAPQLGIIKDYIYGDYKNFKTVIDKDYPNKVGDCPYYKVKGKWWQKLLNISKIIGHNT